MRLLHTADWHVGKVLKGRARADEHASVLGELVELARIQDVDGVVVAGDVFDTGTPTPESQSLVLRALLSPVPASTRGRRAWRHAAAQIEHYRRSYHISDPDRALGAEPNDLAQPADRQRVRVAIERVQAKQRTADRSRDTESTSERISRPRPHQQRGRPGPERVAG
jgi:hypothetical protein